MGVSCKIIGTSVNSAGNFTLYHVSVIEDSSSSSSEVNSAVIKKKHILKKRFNDFYKFKTDLEAQYKTEIPYDFPNKHYAFNSDHATTTDDNNKSWLNLNMLKFYKNTTSTDPEVVSYRQRLLERFLNDLLHDSFDTKWKYNNLTLDFLKITIQDLKDKPRKSTDLTDIYKQKEHEKSSTKNTEKDEWWNIYRECKEILDSNDCSLSEIMRVRLKIQRLKDLLNNNADKETEKEKESEKSHTKKTKFLESIQKTLMSKSIELDTKKTLVSDSDDNLKKLFGDQPNNSYKTDNSSPSDESNSFIQTGRLLGTNKQLYQEQKQMLKNQQQELEDLHKIVVNQKNIGLMINQELQTQNELMDLLGNDISHTSSKMNSASRRAQKYNNES